MKIAMIQSPLTSPTGGERQILKLAIELEKMGHEIEIFTNAVNYEMCFPELLKKVTINVIPQPLQHFKTYRINAFFSMLDIGRKIPHGFDIINNHNFPTEWAAFIAKKKLNIPIVWMCNEPPFWFFHPEERKGISILYWPLFEIFDKIAVKSIDDFVVLSNIAANMAKRVYGRRANVIRSGADINNLQGVQANYFRKEYGLEDDFVLLQVGSLTYFRRTSDSIRAVASLATKYNNLKLVVVGHGSREQLCKLSKRLGIENKVLFLGSVIDEELSKIYSACDVFVFPAELTWGLAVTEAMAAGKPVIVSKKTGASEIIENGINGFVVNHANPKEIATYVEKLINDHELRKRIGNNAYNYIKNNLTWENYAKNMENIFEQVITKKLKNVYK
jgi:glycosyltransferase involved in cell wall biosynthesis